MVNLKNKILNFKIKNKHLVYFGERVRLKTNISENLNNFNCDLYSEIVSKTNFLPENTNIFLRIKYILKYFDNEKHEIPLCPICKSKVKINESLKFDVDFFFKTCGNSYCIAKNSASNIKSQTNEIKLKHKDAQIKYKQNILNEYNHIIELYDSNNFKLIDEVKFNEILNLKITNQFKNSPILSDTFIIENKDFVCSLLEKTKNIVKIPKNIKTKSEFSFNERIYCIKNNLLEKPKCKFCNSETLIFINFKNGYKSNCAKCSTDKFREKVCYPTLSEIKSYIDISKYEILNFPKNTDTEKLIIKCKKCNKISEHFIYNGRGKNLKNQCLCNFCEKYQSNEEAEIRNFLNSIVPNIEIKTNIRTIIENLELDIYIPEKKLAIEFDGLYWHSNLKQDNRNYHLNKTELCEKQGIQLIHIFENEWIYKQDIVKSRLKNLFGVYDKTIYARQCEVKEISSKESKEFQNNNHIQGAVNSKVNIGLFYNDELVSLMTFSKTRFNKNYEYELLRFCNKLGYHIPGAASKLLKYFERNYNPKSLISYADRRWSKGNVYEKLGFKLIHKTKPDYWYFKNNYILESRVKYQKHKLKDLLEKFDETKSEMENMKVNGYNRIFDCGNLVYVKEYI